MVRKSCNLDGYATIKLRYLLSVFPMRNIIVTVAVIISCSGCAGVYLIPTDKSVAELIESNELQPIDIITGLTPIRVSYVNDSYGLIIARNDQYLVEYARKCRGIRPHSVIHMTPMDSKGSLTIRAPFDKIQDCDISQFYYLEKDVELKLAALRES